MHIYDLTVPQFIKVLKNIDAWLEKAEIHAKLKGYDPGVLLQSRLAPDQYPLLRQVQAACDSAKSAVAHLAGKTAPVHPDTEQTWEEIRARIKTCVAYVESIQRTDLDGAENRAVHLPFLPGKVVGGGDYLVDMALPNFYFHVTTAYAILRHNGVEIGKRDFIGGLRFRDG